MRCFLDHLTDRKDYGLDLQVEVAKGGYVTGEEFAVQVKGRGCVSTDVLPAAKIKQSTINYWLRKLAPMMIAIVDTTAKTVFYDSLEYCYPSYPEIGRSQSDVGLILRYNSDAHDIKKEVPACLSRYYQSISNDMGHLSQGIFLSNLLFSISALHRLSTGMAIRLQQIEPSGPEELRQFLQGFFYAFASHDKLMEGLRSGAFGHLPQNQSRFFRVVEHKLSRYDEVRNRFLVYRGETADGDYMVEPRYNEINARLLPMIEVLEDIEETLGLAQVLNKSLVRRVTR